MAVARPKNEGRDTLHILRILTNAKQLTADLCTKLIKAETTVSAASVTGLNLEHGIEATMALTKTALNRLVSLTDPAAIDIQKRGISELQQQTAACKDANTSIISLLRIVDEVKEKLAAAKKDGREETLSAALSELDPKIRDISNSLEKALATFGTVDEQTQDKVNKLNAEVREKVGQSIKPSEEEPKVTQATKKGQQEPKAPDSGYEPLRHDE